MVYKNTSDGEEGELCERESEVEAFDLLQDFVDDKWFQIKVLLIQKPMKFFILSSKPSESHCINYDLENAFENSLFAKINSEKSSDICCSQ